MSHPEPEPSPYTPRWPALWAGLIFVIAALTLCYPMFTGQILLGEDQLNAGYGFREFGAAFFREHGSVPQWAPWQFGGMPYVAAMHGDIFYPTAWLRWVLPVHVAMNLGYAIHIVLAGFFMYLLLRALRLGWVAAVGGGVAYELSGIVVSMVSPGHDGKLFVSALAPLAFFALLRAIRDRQAWGYALFALVVGLGLLSPHYQMTYYLLVATGLWTLYLVFLDPDRPADIRWPLPIAAAFGAVILGLGISAIQAIPFLEYIPHSPRGAGGPSAGWDYATSYSFPVKEVFTTVLPQFNGVLDLYWGGNFFKSHTEYLGVSVVLMAILAFGARERRKLLLGLGVIGLLFLLVAFGRHTPFYRLWYEVMPMMKKVRAPGMAFYLVALVVAVYTGIGLDRVVRRVVSWRTLAIGAGVLGAFALLGAVGGLQTVARTLALPERMQEVEANAPALVNGSVRLLVFVLLTAAVGWAILAGKLRGLGAAAAITVVLVADLWSVDRQFFRFDPPVSTLFRGDPALDRMAQTPLPYRVFDTGPWSTGRMIYLPSQLFLHRVPTMLGYHGNELRYYDDLLGGKNEWRNAINLNLWELLGVRYLIAADSQAVPGFHLAVGPVTNNTGQRVFLYEQDSTPPYVRVVPEAARVPEQQIVPTVTDPRFPFESVVLLPDTSALVPRPVAGAAIPPSPVTASVAEWRPGRMRFVLEGRADREQYLLIAETWYPDWEASVDGQPVPVLRGDGALLTVPFPAGAREVVLEFRDPQYATGRLISLVSVLCVAIIAGVPLVRRRGRAGV